MSVRTPDKDLTKQAEAILSQLEAGAKEVEQEKWHKYKIEVITPIFGGGVKAGVPDTQMPIRASAIRGQLRYWWRFLAKNRRVDPLSGEKLFEKEREIWGGMSEPGEDYSSKVRIKVENVTSHIKPLPYNEGGAPYALFPAREQRGTHEPAKKLIWPKVTFELKVLVLEDKIPKEEDRISIKHALRWWVTFGGIGARTRRGCGSIYCLEPKLAPISETEANAVRCVLKFQGGIKDNALDAWEKAVDCLQKFRQGKDIGGNGKYGRSKWPEPDSIRQLTDSYSGKVHRDGCKKHLPEHPARIAFPRAAFGLPIVFKFKDDTRCGEPLQTELSPTNAERLASPLILTPYPESTNGVMQYKPAALLMPKAHLNTVSLMLGNNHQIENWWDKSKAPFVDPIIDNNGTDALTAFMDFFANGGA